MCPKLVKAALALVLFGGRQKHTGKNSVPVRGDPHILMVGDPGLGKSQMLQVTQKTYFNRAAMSGKDKVKTVKKKCNFVTL